MAACGAKCDAQNAQGGQTKDNTQRIFSEGMLRVAGVSTVGVASSIRWGGGTAGGKYRPVARPPRTGGVGVGGGWGGGRPRHAPMRKGSFSVLSSRPDQT